MESATQCSLRYLRDRGFHAEVVEWWNPYSKTRHDLYGFADIIAAHPNRDFPVLVQCTTKSNVAARKKKIEEIEIVKDLLWNFDIDVHGWGKWKVGGKERWGCVIWALGADTGWFELDPYKPWLDDA